MRRLGQLARHWWDLYASEQRLFFAVDGSGRRLPVLARTAGEAVRVATAAHPDGDWAVEDPDPP